jgi:hypothetical protein
MHTQERRSVFFSTEAGFELFSERVAASPRTPQVTPRVVFDGRIDGPWSRYADVWRVAFEPPSRRFLKRDAQYFLW